MAFPANAAGIRDAICMQILARRDPARGRIRAATNRGRTSRRERGRLLRARARRMGGPSSHLRPPFLVTFLAASRSLSPAADLPLLALVIASI